MQTVSHLYSLLRIRRSGVLFPLLLGMFAAGAVVTVGATSPPAQAPDAAGIEFFEKKVRPVLAQHCYECHSHSAKKGYGDLYLDSRQAILKGGTQGVALVLGEPDKSRLIDAIRYTHPNLQMPPKGKLPEAVIKDLVTWVKMGAPWPDEKSPAGDGPNNVNPDVERRKRQHWAFQPLRRVAAPVIQNPKSKIQNPIDAFLLAKLSSKGLTPVPSADRRTLIRRATFDLIGLPPTPEETDAFLHDKSPDAWKKVIDRLLASPHYGERWGRHWLDVARYGEDQAHSFEPRLYPQGFRYRDWLVNAFNSDMPYDRFVREQIAADLLNEPDKRENLPALGFFALGPVYYGDSKMFDQYDDRIDTMSRGFLGLTVACARCHDHKFDPITQRDYYALAGVFASTAYIEVPYGSADAQDGNVTDRNEKIKKKAEEVDKFLDEHTPPLRRSLTSETARYLVAAWKLHNRRKVDMTVSIDQVANAEKLNSIVLERWIKYLTGDEGKNQPNLATLRKHIQQEDPKVDLSTSEPALAETRKVAEGFQSSLQALIKRGEENATQAKAAADGKKTGEIKDKPAPTPLVKSEIELLDQVVGKEGVLTIPPDKIEAFLVGDPKVHYAVISAELQRLKMGSFVHALTEGPKPGNVPILLRGNPDTPGTEAPRRFLCILAGDNPPPFKQGSGRLELANAIADKNNPLTARVMVNRVWQHHFGTGLVRTTSNFGLLGESPSHPELLDYLTARFIEQGWSLKKLHREIMLSAAYQRSCQEDPKAETVDPENRLLWRMTRRRLEVEAWRDAMLSVSGKLDTTLGGPSVALTEPNNYRRTLYARVSRHDLDPTLRLFDFPDPNVTSDARMTTTVPLQQLFVLNGEFMVAQSKALAARLNASEGESDMDRIRHAFLLLYNRLPSEKERDLGLAFLHASVNTATPAKAGPAADTPSRLSRWEEYTQILLSANEFMYVD